MAEQGPPPPKRTVIRNKPALTKKPISRAGKTATQPSAAGKVNTKPSVDTKAFMNEMRKKKMNQDPNLN